MRALVPVLALLAGCNVFNSQVYLDKDLACSYDPFTWWPDIATAIEYGELGGDRVEWRYPPGPRNINRNVGSYNTATGDYAFHYEYNPEHYNTVYEASGFGTVFTSGDLDILHDVHEEDILGNTVDYRERHLRTGCQGSIETQFPEGSDSTDYTTTYEIIDADTVDYATAFDYTSGGHYSQTWTLDSTYSEAGHISQTASDFSYSADYTKNALQRTQSEWTQSNDTNRYVGTSDRDLTGFLVQDYSTFDIASGAKVATMHIERNYDGSGHGHYESLDRGYTCELTYSSDDSCEYVCDDPQHSTGSC